MLWFGTQLHRRLIHFVRTGSAISLTKWLIVSLLLVHPVFSSAQSPASARELVKQGTLLMSRNKVDAAIERYTHAIELRPNYAEAYVARGMARRAKGNLAGAIEDYEKANSIDPKSIKGNRFVAQAYSNRGFISLNALDVDNAIQDFTIAIRIDPVDPDHHYKRGYARLINEDLPQSLEDLDQSLSISGQDSFLKCRIYATRGMVKLLQGRKEDAQKDFDLSVEFSEGEILMVKRHLQLLESKIMLMRQRRTQQQKSIA